MKSELESQKLEENKSEKVKAKVGRKPQTFLTLSLLANLKVSHWLLYVKKKRKLGESELES